MKASKRDRSPVGELREKVQASVRGMFHLEDKIVNKSRRERGQLDLEHK